MTTRGRYYKAPPDTPAYPGVHNLGSRVWWDSNWNHTVTLGEDPIAPHGWDTGMQPAVLPHSNRIAGDPTCIALGELTTHAAVPGTLDDGFPASCYDAPNVPLDPIFHHAASIWRCQVQLFYARIIDMMYTENIGQAFFELGQFFGSAPRITFHRGTVAFPSVFTIVHPTYAVAIVHGTVNYQQLALQAFATIAGPTNIGIYGTVPLWYNASSHMHQLLLDDGMQPGTAFMMAGHSYGGAITLNLCARYRHADPTRIIRYLTFGAPKPGDTRLINLLRLCSGVDLANNHDFVTVLPPDIHLLNPVIAILGLFGLTVWDQWQSPPNSTLQYEDGHLEVNTPTLLDTATLLGFVQRVLLNLSLFGMPAHTIPEYIQRIGLRCRNDAWPANGNLLLGAFDLTNPSVVFKGLPAFLGRIALRGFEHVTGKLRVKELYRRSKLYLHDFHGGAQLPRIGLGELPRSDDKVSLRGYQVYYSKMVITPPPLADGKIAFLPPLTLPHGLLKLSGDITRDGTTCGKAFWMELGVSYTFTIDDGADVWFQWLAPLGHYHVTCSASGIPFAAGLIYRGNSCAALVNNGFIPPVGGCSDVDNTFLQYIWINVSNNHTGSPQNITFEVDAGTC